MPQPLPADLALGPVGLAVADLGRSLRFYTGELGLEPLQREPGRALVGAGGSVLLELVERPGGRREPAEAGLFHVALRVPDRAALGGILRRLAERGLRLTGAADHGVSEALYLDDPDGHGLELYGDRPREAWHEGGTLRLVSARLDTEGLLAAAPEPSGLPSSTVVGHVHLETHDLAAARALYVEGLGLDVMADWREALFLAKGGYHHHLALNVWNARRRPAHDHPGRIGLLHWTLVAGPGETVEHLTDPSGLELRVRR